MKKIIYLIAIVLISSPAFSQKVDFSGDWKINKEKSELGYEFSMAPNQIILKQAKNSLDIERHSSYEGQDFTFNDHFTLDGEECENPGWMDSIKKSTASWTEDKKGLKITSTVPMQDGGEFTITEELVMNEDNLVISTSASSSYGDMSEKFVFDKQ